MISSTNTAERPRSRKTENWSLILQVVTWLVIWTWAISVENKSRVSTLSPKQNEITLKCQPSTSSLQTASFLYLHGPQRPEGQRQVKHMLTACLNLMVYFSICDHFSLWRQVNLITFVCGYGKSPSVWFQAALDSESQVRTVYTHQCYMSLAHHLALQVYGCSVST